MVPLDRRAALLAGTPAFGTLPPDVLPELAAQLREEAYAPGAAVVVEGNAGDRLYLVADGDAEVSAADPGSGQPIPLAVLHAGDLFGELALLLPAERRQATVTALTPLRLLALERGRFDALLAAYPHARAALLDASRTLLTAKFLKLACPFHSLDGPRLRALAACVMRRTVAAGESIIRQGEPGDTAFLVGEGGVEVVLDTAGEERRLAALGKGAIFGEAALLTDAVRNASVRAIEPGELLVLSRADLLRVLGGDPQAGRDLMQLVHLRQRPRQTPGILSYTRTTADGDTLTILKDPRRRRYYQLSAAGAFVWARLDGAHTLRDLTLGYFEAFRQFAPQAVAATIAGLTLAGFAQVKALRDDVAAVTEGDGDAGRTPLSWHWARDGLDEPLTRLYRAGVRHLYTPLARGVLGLAAAGGLVAFVAGAADARLALQHAGAPLSLWLAPMLLLAVAAHEAGHAFTAKALGYEVPRAGVGWYRYFPVAFVDTTDVWRAGRLERVAVHLAGPYANAVLAGVAAAGGLLLDDPGWMASLWLFALISYGMVLVNLGPMLDLDGYYALSDWAERPELRAQAVRWLGGPRHSDDPRGCRAHRLFWLAALAYLAALALFALLVQRWGAGAGPAVSAIVWLTWTLVVLVGAANVREVITSRTEGVHSP